MCHVPPKLKVQYSGAVWHFFWKQEHTRTQCIVSIDLGTIISYHVSISAAGCPGWILGKCAVGRCSRVRAVEFSDSTLTPPTAPSGSSGVFRPQNLEVTSECLWGVQEGLMLIYASCEENTFIYHYLIRLLKRLNVFLGWFQSCLNFSSFILTFCRWAETTTCNFMFRLVVLAARTILWVGWVRVLNQQKSRQWFFLVYNERDSGWLASPLQRCMSSSQPQLLLLRNLYLQNICYIFHIPNFCAAIVVQYP